MAIYKYTNRQKNIRQIISFLSLIEEVANYTNLVKDLQYNISQADMYQLFAYGKKYQFKNGDTHLSLIYPQQSDFNRQLYFKYEDELSIDIVPFDFQDETKSLNYYSELFCSVKTS